MSLRNLFTSPPQDRLLLSYPERVAKNLDVKAVRLDGGDKNELVFDLVGVDASISNALRRILLAEVNGFGVRFLCRPRKKAFKAGRVLEESQSNAVLHRRLGIIAGSRGAASRSNRKSRGTVGVTNRPPALGFAPSKHNFKTVL